MAGARPATAERQGHRSIRSLHTTARRAAELAAPLLAPHEPGGALLSRLALALDRALCLDGVGRWRRNDGGADEPPLPGWLDRRLRLAARATHQELGEKLCPVGHDKANRWRPRYEPVQYAEYGVGAHYQNWHTDAELDSNDPEDARAITIVMLLRRANKGGKFQVRVNGKASEVALQPGDAIGFPAKRLEHRVTRCQAGLRQSIVCWVKHPIHKLQPKAAPRVKRAG